MNEGFSPLHSGRRKIYAIALIAACIKIQYLVA